MIRERVVDGEPAIDVDTEEEFDQVLSSGAWVIAPPTTDAMAWHPWDEDNTNSLKDVLTTDDDQDPTQDEASDPPSWLIRRLWAWVQG